MTDITVTLTREEAHYLYDILGLICTNHTLEGYEWNDTETQSALAKIEPHFSAQQTTLDPKASRDPESGL